MDSTCMEKIILQSKNQIMEATDNAMEKAGNRQGKLIGGGAAVGGAIAAGCALAPSVGAVALTVLAIGTWVGFFGRWSKVKRD